MPKTAHGRICRLDWLGPDRPRWSGRVLQDQPGL